MKKAIAMKCSTKQYEEIESKLGDLNKKIGSFERLPYLTNFLFGVENNIGNIFESCKSDFDREVFETWNEKVFLEACGIETEPEFVITKEQINTLYEIFEVSQSYHGQDYLKEWFPSAFEPVSEVGKWYFYNKNAVCIYFVTKIEEHNVFAYGINYEGRWRSEELWYNTNDSDDSCLRLATESEVFEALKAEAVKRYKAGDYFQSLQSSWNHVIVDNYELDFSDFKSDGIAYLNGYVIYSNGQWAEIIPTMTKEQAEKQLGKKIIG